LPESVRYNTVSAEKWPLPPYNVLAIISTETSFFDLMSTELLSPKLDELELQDIEKDAVLPTMQQEIECPRCSDIMTLSSDFDKLLYFCQECELSLLLK
jgi:hypothetical protein